MNDALKNITQRNSHRNLISPAPSRKEMELIYQAALRAPDHAWLRPSSFIEIQGDSLKKLSNAFKKALRLGEDQQHGRNDMEELGHHRPNSPFKRGNYFGNQAPWIKIETLRASTAEYVQNSLKKAPRTTIRE